MSPFFPDCVQILLRQLDTYSTVIAASVERRQSFWKREGFRTSRNDKPQCVSCGWLRC